MIQQNIRTRCPIFQNNRCPMYYRSTDAYKCESRFVGVFCIRTHEHKVNINLTISFPNDTIQARSTNLNRGKACKILIDCKNFSHSVIYRGWGCVCKVPCKQSFQFAVDIVNLLIIKFCLCKEVGGTIPQNSISYVLNKRKTFARRRNWESTSHFPSATYLQIFKIITMELSC